MQEYLLSETQNYGLNITMVKETFQNVGGDMRLKGQNSWTLWVERGEKRLESTS